MKKLFIIILITTFPISAFSQEAIRDTFHESRFNATHLTVTGEINAATFNLILNNYRRLTHLDLSQSKIVSYTNEHKDNVLPRSAFYDYGIYNLKIILWNLRKVILPESLVAIEEGAFRENKIDSIIIPSGVKYIGPGAFASCENLNYVSLSDSLQYIDTYAFSGCAKLPSIKVPEKTKVFIGAEAFANCTSLTEFLHSNNIDSIGASAFSGCGFRSFIIPANVSQIKDNTFNNCKFLQSIIIPENVKNIGYGAFAGCSELITINIPKHLDYIEFTPVLTSRNSVRIDSYKRSTFDQCSKLRSFSVAKDNPAFSTRNGILYNKEQTVLIYCPEGIEGEIIIPLSVREIAPFAFQNSNISSVIIGGNVRKIGYGAFYASTKLTSIKFPEKLKEIAESAFFGCTGLVSIELSKNLERIENQLFSGCTVLTDIKFSENLKEIGKEAFAGCIGMISMELPEKLEKIESSAFINCSGLTTIKLPNNLKEIGEGAFAFSGLTTITIPKNISEIRRSIFRGSRLETVIIPENVKIIEEAAFRFCRNLKKISVYWQEPALVSVSDIFTLFDDNKKHEKNCILEVPFGTKEKYLDLEPWKYFQVVEKP